MAWTPKRDAELLKRWETESASHIARAFGDVTRNAVIGRIHRLKDAYGPYEEQRREEARARTREQKARQRAIAERELQGFEDHRDRKDMIMRALAKGTTQADIAAVLGVSRQRISQIVLS